jgi:hypothetical protein
MATVDVTDIIRVPLPEQGAGGFVLDSPQAHSRHDVYALRIEGWYAPEVGSPELRLVVLGVEEIEVQLNVPRPDVITEDPEATVGFRVWLNALRLPPEFEIQLLDFGSGNAPEWLATITGRRDQLRPIPKSRFNPIILTSFGRTGGTWVTNLIGKHPEIVAFRPFQYESRIATYWIDVFTALSEPTSYMQALSADAGGSYWWLGEKSLGPQMADTAAPDFARWLGKENLQDLQVFCHGRIEEAYSQAAIFEDRPDARFFIERAWPVPVTHLVMRSLFPQTKEIVLVRDFRDMVASILAYNERRGLQYFGRADWGSDEEFVRSLHESLDHIVNSWRKAKETTFLLKYEDLVRSPRQTLEHLLDYVGVESQADVVEHMLRADAADQSTARTAHQTSVSAEDSIGRWQRDLSDPVREACQGTFGDLLAELGYEAGVTETGSRA